MDCCGHGHVATLSLARSVDGRFAHVSPLQIGTPIPIARVMLAGLETLQGVGTAGGNHARHCRVYNAIRDADKIPSPPDPTRLYLTFDKPVSISNLFPPAASGAEL